MLEPFIHSTQSYEPHAESSYESKYISSFDSTDSNTLAWQYKKGDARRSTDRGERSSKNPRFREENSDDEEEEGD